MLRDTFNETLKTAMKAGDKATVSTVRLIIAALKEKDTEPGRTGKAGDDEIMPLLQKMLKQRQESVDVYRKAGRDDLADGEAKEMAIIASFLPKPMDEAEQETAIRTVIAEIGAQGMKDMGKVIATLRERFAGRMDFGKASGVVKRLLAG